VAPHSLITIVGEDPNVCALPARPLEIAGNPLSTVILDSSNREILGFSMRITRALSFTLER
jgi:hypothetical protein